MDESSAFALKAAPEDNRKKKHEKCVCSKVGGPYKVLVEKGVAYALLKRAKPRSLVSDPAEENAAGLVAPGGEVRPVVVLRESIFWHFGSRLKKERMQGKRGFSQKA